jgi:hypothetical protein
MKRGSHSRSRSTAEHVPLFRSTGKSIKSANARRFVHGKTAGVAASRVRARQGNVQLSRVARQTPFPRPGRRQAADAVLLGYGAQGFGESG